MKIDRIKYEETFPTAIQYKNIRLTAEATIDSDKEDLAESYGLLRKTVNEAFKAMNFSTEPIFISPEVQYGPHPFFSEKIVNGVKKKEEIKVGVTMDDIKSCQDIKTLASYKFIVKGKVALQAAYDRRMVELKTPPKKNGKIVMP